MSTIRAYGLLKPVFDDNGEVAAYSTEQGKMVGETLEDVIERAKVGDICFQFIIQESGKFYCTRKWLMQDEGKLLEIKADTLD